MSRLLLGVLLTLSPVVIHAEIYRWVDDNGTTHFSDEAPAGVDAQEAELPRLIVVPGTSEYERRRLKAIREEESERRRQREAARRAARKHQRQAASDRKACDEARERVDGIRAELRRGYSIERGKVLERRLETLRARLREDCAGY